MAYNRWLAPDELMHHGVKGQRKGIRNGPPYPLSRQEKFRTVGPDGRPITSKKAYKKAMSVERAKKKQERAAHPNGTPEDHKERNSLVAKIKRGYRQYKSDRKKELEQAEQERRDWLTAKKRLDDSDIPDDVKKKMLRDALGYDPDDKLRGQHWGVRNGPPYPSNLRGDSDGPVNTGVAEKLWDNDTFSGDDTDSQRLNKIIDAYGKKEKAKRDAAKEHGTAEEVMKYRDTFTADEWKGIAERLNQEKRVQDLLPKSSKENNNNNGKQEATFVAYKFADKKTQQIYDHGRARDVFQNRDKFTPEQLNSIAVRLKAEEEIAKYADTQFDPQGKTGERLKKAADVLKTITSITGSMSSIAKNLGLKSDSGGDGKKKGDGNKNKDGGGGGNKSKAEAAIDGATKVIGLVNFVNDTVNAAQQTKQNKKQDQNQKTEKAPEVTSEDIKKAANEQQSYKNTTPAASKTTYADDWGDRLSKIGKISKDEESKGKDNPLEKVGRVSTDEDRKKKKK